MSTTLRMVLLAAILIYFAIVIVLLKNKKLELKYSLLWLFMGVCFLLLTIFPEILFGIRDLLGFGDNMNALYVCLIGFILVLVMSLTSITSRQAEKIKDLIQDNALLEKRIRELEKKVENNE